MRSTDWSTLADLRCQLERYWDNGRLLAASLRNESLFPLELKIRAPDPRACSERFDEVRRWIRELESDGRYQIDWVELNHRVLGRNRIPARILVRTERDALSLIGKTDETARFRALCDETLGTLPELSMWLTRKPLVALENAGDWARILAVLMWFCGHMRTGLYLRQLDIAGVDTKFIEGRRALLAELLDIVLPADAFDATAVGSRNFEQRYGLAVKPSQIRFRILDQRFSIQGLTDLAVTAREFATLELPVKHVFITENEINGLAFPNVPASLVIFGLGYGLERLAEVRWLRQRDVHYWGDIDTYGFHILDRLRLIFPSAQSFLMDRQTLLEHVPVWVQEENPYHGELRRLTDTEGALYEDLRCNRLGDRVRLEQERIRYGWVESTLHRLAGVPGIRKPSG
jgi:hypothetical protein